jgi:hypothetical protein
MIVWHGRNSSMPSAWPRHWLFAGKAPPVAEPPVLRANRLQDVLKRVIVPQLVELDIGARTTRTPAAPGCGCRSARTDLCPVKALDAWVEAAAITEGPLFRRIWRLPPPRVVKGAKPGPAPARYRIGSNRIDTDSIALIVKNWTGLAGFDGAAFAGHSLRRGAISSGVAAGVHIARFKQFSDHASLKSLEE